MKRLSFWIVSIAHITLFSATVSAQQAGGIRGMVYDKDFDVPLAGAQVLIVETGQKTAGSDEGNYVFDQVAPGAYTLVFSKEGYARQVKADVVVSLGRMAELDVYLAGDFTEMEDFIVQDVLISTGTEAALLQIRLKSPAMMDSISADLMSQAGVSDAASALTLVSGATVQEGKYAVVRGLPDRYVNSQMNSVRLPTADFDKRAVHLDQFPSAVIESVQVSKTFTPDQQGDASGGAVNVVLKGIPEETNFKLSTQYSHKTNATGNDDFLSYKGGGVDVWGMDDGSRNMQASGTDWGGAVGVTETDAPMDYKWSLSGGGTRDFSDFRLGAFASFFYERDSSFFDNGINDEYWVDNPGESMTPKYTQGAPAGADEKFFTSLFDVTQASQEVKWGTLATIGIENEDNRLSFVYMYTQTAEDKVTLAENTRGKKSLNTYWPHNYGHEFLYYTPYDMNHPGNQVSYRESSPYLRNETLEYTQRSTQTFQLSGRHALAEPDLEIENVFTLLRPEWDWVLSHSSSTMDQPDKRLFATSWTPRAGMTGIHAPLRSADTFNLGNLQRVWKEISEESSQVSTNIKFPFKQWTGDEGYLKFGAFYDDVDREYKQESFSNFGTSAFYEAPWERQWSAAFPYENHFMSLAAIDVDYDGQQKISAWYNMIDLPLNSSFNIIGGTRFETTDLGITNYPEDKVEWYPTDTGPVKLNPGDADVEFKQNDILPSIGFSFTPWEPIKIRGSYSETLARQTFKELTPIKQQEFLGGDIFIGNPYLQMSELKNYDLRVDYTPYEGGLLSLSYFYKDVDGPIEYVQKAGNGFTFIKPVNYPKGELSGVEIEARQKLGQLWKKLEGLSVGANATFINSEVTLPREEAQALAEKSVPETKRDMTNAPECLYNLYLTYDLDRYGTRFGIFYTIRGDTLITGAGHTKGAFVPSVYETEFGTLNLSLSQKLGKIWSLKFQAKNLLDPDIETVYRSDYIGNDVTKTSHQKGREFSISLSATF